TACARASRRRSGRRVARLPLCPRRRRSPLARVPAGRPWRKYRPAAGSPVRARSARRWRLPISFGAVSALLPAIYLAAGEGRRLRPLTEDRPKAMLEVGDVSVAERALP